MTWLAGDRATLGVERILDAAGALFAERGVAGVSMGEVAGAAGCSRATLYRYFADRGALRSAFVEREATRLGAVVAAETRGSRHREVDVVLVAVRLVREHPALAAWFSAGDAGLGVEAALSLGLGGDDEDARWLVRGIVSLLTMPGRDPAEERRLAQRYAAAISVDQGLSPAP